MNMYVEKPSFVVNGGIKLPIGYRFRPTDEELVVHYLKRKVFGLPLPASVIPEFDVFQTDPWSLPGDLKEQKRYFFGNNRNGNAEDKKSKIAAGSGYWKPSGKDRQILASGSGQAVGIRKTLVFCQGKRAQQTKTQWVMHEHRLVNVGTATNPNSTHMIPKTEIGDWVVHRIFQRKRKPKKHSALSNQTTNIGVTPWPSCINFAIEADQSDLLGPPQPSSPSSSEITADVMISATTALDQEETSGYSNLHSCTRKR